MHSVTEQESAAMMNLGVVTGKLYLNWINVNCYHCRKFIALNNFKFN